MEYFCGTCMRNREARLFSKWFEDKSKCRRCNDCQDSEKVRDRMRKAEKEAKELRASSAMPMLTPILKKLSQSRTARHSCEVRAKIEAILDMKRINAEFED